MTEKAAMSSPPPTYQQATTPPVEVAQPKIVYVAPTPIPPHEAPDHMAMAIIATICCCLPIGIVAIVKASGEMELSLVSFSWQ